MRSSLRPTRQPGALHPRDARLTIGSLDEPNLTVTAHYNPHELAIQKSMPWSSKNEQAKPTAETRSEQDSHEYKGTPSRSMTLELLFDGYEEYKSVEPIAVILDTLSTVRDPESKLPEMLRPHYCVVVFGDGIRLRCIMTSLQVKYTMFAGDGTPLRMVCTIELQEARLKSSFGALRGAGADAAEAVGRSLAAAASFFRG
jgi:hypothetical protein